MKRSTILLGLFGWALATGCSPTTEQQARSARGFAMPQGSVQAGQEAFVELRCTTCHEVDGLENELPSPTATPVVGVKLGGSAMREPTDGELLTSVMNPSHKLYPADPTQNVESGGESRMANLNDAMTVQQLIDIVAFLHDRYVSVNSDDLPSPGQGAPDEQSPVQSLREMLQVKDTEQ